MPRRGVPASCSRHQTAGLGTPLRLAVRDVHVPLLSKAPSCAQITGEAPDFLQALLRKDPAARPSIGDVLGHPWLAAAAGATAEGRLARHDVKEAKPAAPSGVDSQASIAGTSALDIHAALVAIEAPMRMAAMHAAPPVPIHRRPPAQVRSRVRRPDCSSDIRVGTVSAACWDGGRPRGSCSALAVTTSTASPVPRHPGRTRPSSR